MHRTTVVLISALASTLTLSVWAGKVQSWRQRTKSDFDKGTYSHTVVTSKGTVQLSRDLKQWSDLKAEFVWDLALDGKGNLYAATGEEGKVLKVTPKGKASVLFDSDEQHVFCIAARPDGTVYAGTAPHGLVLKIAPDGKCSTLFKTGKHYVWDLVVDGKGTLYAATGSGAEVFRIGPDGKGQSLYKARQKHMLALALGPDNTLYAGCDGDGLVYRIDSKGKAFVLYDAAQAEVRTLLAATDGALFVGTSSTSRLPSSLLRRSSPTSRPSSSKSAKTKPVAKTGPKQTLPRSSTSTSSRLGRSSASSRTMPSKTTTGTNAVYRIAPDGSVRRLFQERVLMLCLAQQKQRLLVGTGQSGRLFEWDSALRQSGSLARLDHGQILSMVRRPDGSVVLGTGDPGRLYTLSAGYAATGTYVSQVFDSRLVSRWGAVQWQADVPQGTRITLAVRTGNVAKPDETWSDWSQELSDPSQSSVPCPPARFLQFRATLHTSRPDLTPTLHSVVVRYLTANQAPEVSKIDVPDVGEGDGGSRLTKFKIKWSAQDPNKDALRYELSFRKQDWKNWVRLANKLTKTEYEWDVTAVPEGRYRLRVVASDRADNPPDKALNDTLESNLFVIDHSPPAVKLKSVSAKPDEAAFEVQATDNLTRIARAYYSVDSGDWTRIFPLDLLFDSQRESFRFAPPNVSPGSHLVMVRVVDAAGNTGTADLVFSIEKGK